MPVSPFPDDEDDERRQLREIALRLLDHIDFTTKGVAPVSLADRSLLDPTWVRGETLEQAKARRSQPTTGTIDDALTDILSREAEANDPGDEPEPSDDDGGQADAAERNFLNGAGGLGGGVYMEPPE